MRKWPERKMFFFSAKMLLAKSFEKAEI